MTNRVQGDIPQGSTDQGTSNPIKVGGLGRQTNPSPVEDNTRVAQMHDDLGRQIIRHQVRDLMTSAYVSLTGGTKTELKAGVSGAYLDLYQISCYNNSDAATVVVLSDESTTVRSIPVAASSVQNLRFDPPLKQSATGVSWYVDIPDITGTTIEVAAEFSKEV